MKHEEKDIIDLLKKGDETCVKMMFDNYYQLLCVFALRFLHSFDDAEDVVQDVFVNFWEKKKGTAFSGSLKSYLLGAVQKAALYHKRSEGDVVFESIDAYADLLADDMPEEREEELLARKEKLYKELQLLPEKCREVFMTVVLEGLSYKETAEKLNVSVNTVKTHYTRALKQLRNNLDTIVLLFLLHGKICRSVERVS